MTKPKSKPKTKTRKPLTISIHGADLAIEATFNDEQIGKLLAEALTRAMGNKAAAPAAAPMSTSDPVPPATVEEHDFDTVRRVITLAEPAVLQAILDMARDELEKRASVS